MRRNKYISADSALGLVSTLSFPAIVGTADMMLKSAEVILVGYEKIGGGHCTVRSPVGWVEETKPNFLLCFS